MTARDGEEACGPVPGRRHPVERGLGPSQYLRWLEPGSSRRSAALRVPHGGELWATWWTPRTRGVPSGDIALELAQLLEHAAVELVGPHRGPHLLLVPRPGLHERRRSPGRSARTRRAVPQLPGDLGFTAAGTRLGLRYAGMRCLRRLQHCLHRTQRRFDVVGYTARKGLRLGLGPRRPGGLRRDAGEGALPREREVLDARARGLTRQRRHLEFLLLKLLELLVPSPQRWHHILVTAGQ